MRLFVSIDLTESIQKMLDQRIPELPLLRKPKPEQLHLTLLFLGECTSDQKDEIIQKLSGLVVKPFHMKIEGTGAFPDKKNPKVIWAGVQRHRELVDLQHDIRESLARFTDITQNRIFKPHITLARVKGEIDTALKIKLFQACDPLQFHVDHFTLKKSTLQSIGSEHKIVWQSGFR